MFDSDLFFNLNFEAAVFGIFGGKRLKRAVSWGFGIISKAQKWINRNRNRKIMVYFYDQHYYSSVLE